MDHNSNSTNSVLNLVPSVGDGGKFLKCRAENVEMAASQIEDSWNLEINCKTNIRAGSRALYSHFFKRRVEEDNFAYLRTFLGKL